MKNIYLLFTFLFLVGFLHAQVIYVKHDAGGYNDGTSWEDAYIDLNVALNNSAPNDSIWVAQGTYTPGSDPQATFTIEHDLILLGGFQGNEMLAEDRDPDLYATILSGDLDGNDVQDDFENYRTDNAWTVIRINNNVSAAMLMDGFTISHGHADGPLTFQSNTNGGGIYSLGSPVFRRCDFTQNYALEVGGGLMHNGSFNSAIVLDDCHFYNNRAGGFAAAQILNSWFDINDCSFNNSTYHPVGGDYGGAALYILDPLGGSMRNTEVSGNLGE